MLLVTDAGHYFTVVEDFDDPAVLWVRSQDRASIVHAITVMWGEAHVERELVNEPSWDYQFRVAMSRETWASYLEHVTEETHSHKLKPAVAAARGKTHPISKMVEEVFYYMSYNRPDRSKPAWVTGGKRAR